MFHNESSRLCKMSLGVFFRFCVAKTQSRKVSYYNYYYIKYCLLQHNKPMNYTNRMEKFQIHQNNGNGVKFGKIKNVENISRKGDLITFLTLGYFIFIS